MLFIYRPKFRSYKPQDQSLKENTLDEAKPGDIISEVQEQLDASKTKFTVEELVRNHFFHLVIINIEYLI